MKQIKKNKSVLAVCVILGFIAGLLVFSLPNKYVAEGTLFIKRTAETSNSFFTYEGYYSQQAAAAYTNTVSGLLESVDLQSSALIKLGIPVNEDTTRRYAHYISVKKSSPQLITVTVKQNSPDSAKQLWTALVDELLSTNGQINQNGDTKLSISEISTQPVVNQTFKSIWLDAVAGILFGAVLGLAVISLKDYD
jgi:capsular polysaccharide biosynthesis protein